MADITMPQLGETVTEGTITKWFKAVGDAVAEDEPLFEVSTDKVDSEVPSPVSGTLTEIKVPEGDTVDVGVVLAVDRRCRRGARARPAEPEAGARARGGRPSRAARAGGRGRAGRRRPRPRRPARRRRPRPPPRPPPAAARARSAGRAAARRRRRRSRCCRRSCAA